MKLDGTHTNQHGYSQILFSALVLSFWVELCDTDTQTDTHTQYLPLHATIVGEDFSIYEHIISSISLIEMPDYSEMMVIRSTEHLLFQTCYEKVFVFFCHW